MLETKKEIREYILRVLGTNKTDRIAKFNSKCKNEKIFFDTLEEMVRNGEIKKDSAFVWLP